MTSSLHAALEDLAARFIINLPSEELESGVERICFQLEQAHWFYVDFVQVKDASLPRLSLPQFAQQMFQQCALLRPHLSRVSQILKSFSEYKQKVPVCGAIVFNADMSKVLMVKGWGKQASWSFPRGKINQSESKLSCAVREVREETGFDMTPFVVPDDFIEVRVHDSVQEVCLFTVPCVPETTPFLPQTRQEISDIKWFYVTDLDIAAAGKSATQTKSFYLLKPFLKGLRAYSNRIRASLSLPPLFPYTNNTTPAANNNSSSASSGTVPAVVANSTPKKKLAKRAETIAAMPAESIAVSRPPAAAPSTPAAATPKKPAARAQSATVTATRKAPVALELVPVADVAPATPVPVSVPVPTVAAAVAAGAAPGTTKAVRSRGGDAWLDFRFDVDDLLSCFETATAREVRAGGAN
jgi:mRNA-decapping enzyme subunit 2